MGPFRRFVLLSCFLALVAGCGHTTLTSAPSPVNATAVRWPSGSGPAFDGAQVMGVTTVTGGGCVAVGITGPPGAPVPVAWTSRDCRSWVASPLSGGSDEVPQNLPGGSIRSAVTTTVAGTLVAVGDQFVAADEESSAAAVWTSPTGIDWTSVDDRGDLGMTPSYVQGAPQGPVHLRSMTSVARDGAGVVAAGSDDGAAAVWTSTDLATWTRTDLPAAASGAGGDQATAIVDRPQGLVVGGSRSEYTENGEVTRTVPVVWTGPTPNRLTPVVLPATMSNVTVNAITIAGSTLVAAGSSGTFYGSTPHQPTVWTSHDQGRTWSETLLPGGGDIDAAVATPGGVLLAGTSTHNTEDGPQALVWRSADLVTFTRPVTPGAGGVLAAGVLSSGVLLAGNDGVYATKPAPIWLAPG